MFINLSTYPPSFRLFLQPSINAHSSLPSWAMSKWKRPFFGSCLNGDLQGMAWRVSLFSRPHSNVLDGFVGRIISPPGSLQEKKKTLAKYKSMCELCPIWAPHPTIHSLLLFSYLKSTLPLPTAQEKKPPPSHLLLNKNNLQGKKVTSTSDLLETRQLERRRN